MAGNPTDYQTGRMSSTLEPYQIRECISSSVQLSSLCTVNYIGYQPMVCHQDKLQYKEMIE